MISYLPDIIPLVSCQYSNSDTKQSIPLFDENESNSSLYYIRKHTIIFTSKLIITFF